MLITEWIIMMIPANMVIDRDDTNGLNSTMAPTIKSSMPSSNNMNQFESTSLIVIDILIILTLERMIQTPSAIVRITESIPGIAMSRIPRNIDNTPDIIPSNGVKNLPTR